MAIIVALESLSLRPINGSTKLVDRLKQGVCRRRTTALNRVGIIRESHAVTITRWTIRGVEDALIEQVRAIHRRTGFRFGQIVSAAIRLGLPAALAELRAHGPSPRLRARGFFAMLGEISKASQDDQR
jgi:hypothetical protein